MIGRIVAVSGAGKDNQKVLQQQIRKPSLRNVDTKKKRKQHYATASFFKTKFLFMEILVFKTDIRNKKRIIEAEPFIENIEGIIKWNVDLHDRDNILRVEADTISPRIIEQKLQQAGYYCEELED